MSVPVAALPPFARPPLPAAGAAARRTELLLAAAATALAPINYLRLPAFYFTASDMAALLCLCVMLANGTVRLRPLGAGTAPWLLGLGLLSAGLLASSIAAGAVDRGLIAAGQYVYSYFLLPVVICARPWRETILLVKLFVASILAMCVHGIWLIHFAENTTLRFVSGSRRLLSFVERENELASLMSMTAPLLLWLAAARLVHAITAAAAMLLLLYGLTLTGSNTGLMTMVVGCAVFGLATLNLRQLMTAAAFAAGLFFAVIQWGHLFLPAVFQKRVLGALESGDIDQAGTFSGRYDLIVEAFGFADDHLLMGMGADQYRVISAHGAPVHNAYLLIWTEGGLIALCGLLLMMAAGGIVASRAARRRGGRVSAACALAVLLLFMVMINAIAHVYARFWVAPLALALSIAVLAERDGPPPPRRRRASRPAPAESPLSWPPRNAPSS